MNCANFPRAHVRFINYVHLFPKFRCMFVYVEKKYYLCAVFEKMVEITNISSHILSPQTKLIVFDLDGTLYAKPHMVWHMLCAAPCDWRLMLAERKTRKQLRGQWLGDEDTFYQTYFQTMANYCKSSPEDLRYWYFNRYMPLMVSVISKYYKPVDWLAPFLADCKNQGCCFVVLSDYGHTHEKLHALNINESLFDWVISAPELGGLKPAPQLMEKVLENMGVTSAECLVIGDREDTDGILAKSVGASFRLIQNS